MKQEQAFQARVDRLPWDKITASLSHDGVALLPGLLRRLDCLALQKLFGLRGVFYKRVAMEEKGYGRGEYGYFNTPPAPARILRKAFYEAAVPLANAWAKAALRNGKTGFGIRRYPKEYEAFMEICARNGQKRNACLLLEYGAGGYNVLHQDRYGAQAIAFPFQLVVQLTLPGKDFSGGDFQLEEAGKIRSFSPGQGMGIIFPSVYRIAGHEVRDVKHGVAPVSGRRMTMGIIAHGLDS